MDFLISLYLCVYLCHQTAAQGELLRQQNGEKMALERELAKAEQGAFDSTLNDLENNRRRTVETMMDALALKMQGRMTPLLFTSHSLLHLLFIPPSLFLTHTLPY
jgi:hypothetical protein